MSRLSQLEDAHRALAAQHTALVETYRALLPLFADYPAAAAALTAARARCMLSMQSAGVDAAYQASVESWLSVFLFDTEMPDHASPPH
jgi:predicted transcriptional regulator